MVTGSSVVVGSSVVAGSSVVTGSSIVVSVASSIVTGFSVVAGSSFDGSPPKTLFHLSTLAQNERERTAKRKMIRLVMLPTDSEI